MALRTMEDTEQRLREEREAEGSADDCCHAYQERAAILEFLANLPRREAERIAAQAHPPCDKCRPQPKETA